MAEIESLILTRLDRVIGGMEELKQRMSAVENAVVLFDKRLASHGEAVAHQWEVLDKHREFLDKLADRINEQGLRLEKLETI